MLTILASLLLTMSLGAQEPRAELVPVAIAGDSARSDAEVRASVLRNTTDIRRCYETEGLPRNPTLSGRMELALTILPTGVVSSVRVDSLALGGPGSVELARCLTRHARNWRFERGNFATETHSFPLDFVPETARPIVGGETGGVTGEWEWDWSVGVTAYAVTPTPHSHSH